jgi:hypothetical protein
MKVQLLVLAILLGACGGASTAPTSAPLDRCNSTISSLQMLEPACWYEAGAPRDAGVPD